MVGSSSRRRSGFENRPRRGRRASPAARVFAERPILRRSSKPRQRECLRRARAPNARQYRRRYECRRSRAGGSVAGSPSSIETGALEIGGENEIRSRFRAAWSPPARRGRGASGADRRSRRTRRELARNHAEKRRLPCAVAPDKADPRMVGKRRSRFVEENPSPNRSVMSLIWSMAGLSPASRCIARESEFRPKYFRCRSIRAANRSIVRGRRRLDAFSRSRI